MSAGDTVRIETPGGAGFGDPAERSIGQVAADLRSGKVSREKAEQDYGIDRVLQAMALESVTFNN